MSTEATSSSIQRFRQGAHSMYQEITGNRDTRSPGDVYLILAELLNQTQPYEKLSLLKDPELDALDLNDALLKRIQGSLVGLAIGDALGASVEFRPNAYMQSNRVTDMQGGGTWGLAAGHWTDDTSMALCLAASLIVKGDFDGYDQMVRYKRWFRNGYLSSTGECFDIGKSTREAILTFETRQQEKFKEISKEHKATVDKDTIDRYIADHRGNPEINVNCGSENAAGNGALMRLAPVALLYFDSQSDAIENAGKSAKLTHGDKRAIDACRFYGALIQRALTAKSKEELLNPKSYQGCFKPPLDDEILTVVGGSYRGKAGYEAGIRGKGFVVQSLEAALWAFWSDQGSFKTGVLSAVNLGDDTDTTAAIYGQLAGAFYGIDAIPAKWREQLFQEQFITKLANGLYLRGKNLSGPPLEREATANNRTDPATNNHRPKSESSPSGRSEVIVEQ